MANKIISGCVDRSTGEIIFEGEACDSSDYAGCIERTGEHAGQVAITVSETYCDDTYYGCISRSTGQFNVSIPDDCCEEPPPYCECAYGVDSVMECWAAGETPLDLAVTFSGVRYCSGGTLITNLNTLHCLRQQDCTFWEKISLDLGIGLPVTITYSGDLFRLWVHYYYYGTTYTFFVKRDGSCPPDTMVNSRGIIDCGGQTVGYDGEALVEDPCV